MFCAFIPYSAAVAPLPAVFAPQPAAPAAIPAVFAQAAPLPTAFAACAFDLRTGRIPNALLFAGITGALAFDLSVYGVSGIRICIGGMLPPLLLIPAFLMHGVGAGDIKLLMTLGAYLGAEGSCALLVRSLVFGGILSLIMLCRGRDLRSRLRLSVPVLAGLLVRPAGLLTGGFHG